MGIRYSELTEIHSPNAVDLVAVLHKASSTLVTTSLQEAVDCTLGDADISSIGDGTVKGAIAYVSEHAGGTAIAATYINEDAYLQEPESVRKDGRFRLVL